MSRFLSFLFIGMLFSCLFLCEKSFAVAEKPVSLEAAKVERLDQGKYSVDLLFKVKPDWHVYAHDESENGLPLKIELVSQNAKITEVIWPESAEEVIESEGVVIRTKFYKGEFTIPVKFEADSINNVVFKIELGACNKICIAQTEEISVKISNGCVICDFLFYGVLALLGGLILNFMPCVFPVISLKVFSFASGREEKFRESAVFTVLGIIFSYLVLAVVTIVLKHLGESIGWGLHFQSSYFVIFLAFIMTVFAYNLNGDFEILVSTGDLRLIDNLGERAKSFFIGATATLLATPCTAPFLSTAVAFAITKDWPVILYIYFMLGLGMSIPFLAFAIFPNASKYLPKSGSWMIKLKKFFAVLFLITAFWLIYILYFQISLSSLILFVLSLLLLKFLLGFRIIYESLRNLILLLVISLALIYVGVGHFENRQLKHEIIYSEGWQKYSDEYLEELISKGEIVLVDVTAEWCVTCKLNKLTTLGNESVINFLKENKIILLRADVTNSNDSVKNLMKLHDRFGVPLNVIYSQKNKNGYLLPHILTPNIIYEAVKENRRTD